MIQKGIVDNTACQVIDLSKSTIKIQAYYIILYFIYSFGILNNYANNFRHLTLNVAHLDYAVVNMFRINTWSQLMIVKTGKRRPCCRIKLLTTSSKPALLQGFLEVWTLLLFFPNYPPEVRTAHQKHISHI